MRNFFRVVGSGIGITLLTMLSVSAHADYYLQMGAFKTKSNAQKLLDKAQTKMKQSITIHQSSSKGKPLYVVQAGPYADLKAATLAKNMALKAQIASLIVSRNHPDKPVKATAKTLQPTVTPTFKEPQVIQSSETLVKQSKQIPHPKTENTDNRYGITFIKDAYYIQIGEYEKQSTAKLVHKAASAQLNFPVLLKEGQKQGRQIHFVCIGPFIDLDEAISYRRMTAKELDDITNQAMATMQNKQSSSQSQQANDINSRLKPLDNQRQSRKISKVARFRSFFG